MLQKMTAKAPPTSPLRPLRLLVEDPQLFPGDLTPPSAGIEITACGGPQDEREVCPLVMDGTCPLGRFDVVVSALGGPWARSVRAAWSQTATPMVDASDVVTSDPAERLVHHVGAALQRLSVPYTPDE